MKLNILFLFVLHLCSAASGEHLITVCPGSYSSQDNCVTLHQLQSNTSYIKSNTTIKLVPTTFKVQSDTIITIANVNNITIESTGPNRANISCIGNNSGLLFRNISGLVIRKINFIHCGTAPKSPLSNGATFAISLSESANIVLNNLSFQDGEEGGVFAENIYKKLDVFNTLFTNMQGTCLQLMYHHSSTAHGQPTVTVSNIEFSNNYHQKKGKAWAIYIALEEPGHPITVDIIDVMVKNNTHSDSVSTVYFRSDSSHESQISMKRYTSKNNFVIRSAIIHPNSSSSEFLYERLHIKKPAEDSVLITDSKFINNIYKDNQSVYQFFTYNPYNFLHFISTKTPLYVKMKDTTISNNTGKHGAAVVAQGGQHHDFKLVFINSTFANNNISSSLYGKKGIIELQDVVRATFSDCSFVNNSVTGIFVQSSNIYFGGTNHFIGNRAYNGGGMVIDWTSMHFTLLHGARIVFDGNKADNQGGGIFLAKEQCLNFVIGSNTEIKFNNNFAKIAGNDIYGGDFHSCFIDGRPAWLKLTDIIHFPRNYTLDVTSDPLHVCDCSTDKIHDCINISPIIKTLQTYPGRKFNLSVLAVSHLLNITTLSGVPSPVYATLLPKKKSTLSRRIPHAQLVQNIERTCSNLTYTINSSSKYEVMVLAVSKEVDKLQEYFEFLWQKHIKWHNKIEEVLAMKLVVPAYVKIDFLSCPTGFELSLDGACVCNKALKNVIESCSIDEMLITKAPSTWLAVKSKPYRNGHSSDSPTLYLTHDHCPYDYCKSGSLGFSLNDAGAQCDSNHSGILCGECKPGYSLVLGSTECRKCTNIYLFLLIPFQLAGILLVIFLSLTDMTVAVGTINGLLFYANILTENKSTFFPPRASKSFLSVFIAWLSLDLGIDTCFYDGMDAFTSTWLQLSFPIYIWLLALGIILACRHFTLMNKLCGTNIVHVLATLFLLSYTKLQNTIATSLSFTVVRVSNGEKLFVWLKDGNVPYLQGKHVALFLFNLLLSFLLLLYTLTILLGSWMQRKTAYRVFRKLMRLKPLFDAYYGPLKDQHRYWTGLLLLSRIILSLVSAVNVFGNDSINLLAIISVSMLLLWWSRSVYKSLIFCILDGFFLLNLGVLASVTLFNKFSTDYNQSATIYISIGSTFVVFCVILIFHCIRRIKKWLVARQKTQPLLNVFNKANGEDNSDEDMLDVIDIKREGVKK